MKALLARIAMNCIALPSVVAMLCVSNLFCNITAYAATSTDDNFDDNLAAIFNNQNTSTLDGVKYTTIGVGAYSHITSNNFGYACLITNASDYFLLSFNGDFHVGR